MLQLKQVKSSEVLFAASSLLISINYANGCLVVYSEKTEPILQNMLYPKFEAKVSLVFKLHNKWWNIWYVCEGMKLDSSGAVNWTGVIRQKR